jgi:hypothetical protein
VTERTVHCDEHGTSTPTFVCRHLAASLQGGPTRLGFVSPDPTEDTPNAWCAACDGVLVEAGAWNDKSEGYAGVTMICRVCFERTRTLNSR